MKYIILLVVVGACFAFDKESMLKHNKIGKEVPSTCDECQSLVKRFSDAAKDPKKLAELKMLLNVLCHETAYVDECRVFVSRLDVIVKKLEPFLVGSLLVSAECRWYIHCEECGKIPMLKLPSHCSVKVTGVAHSADGLLNAGPCPSSFKAILIR
ncbi:unnamed protein product [Heligmosomoides polygyrus]|uniref:Saposin B-type domain-containing protein n=1 Tax=Heligmosomoides polygyrus TaxID=6339 RepID=A0A183F924_HELPZ|nr:unnamed protein product [Heligmosomoides polygyrus]